jgi:glycosyltransferase involved in cell wall biosynthesis
MVLYFSARTLQPEASGGIVRYFIGLVEALAKKPELKIHSGLTPMNFQQIGSQLPGNVTIHHITGLVPELWEKEERGFLAQIRPDWVIYCYPDLLDAYKGDYKTAVCIPDLQHLAKPFFFPPGARAIRDEAFGTAIGSADLIFTLSRHAKEQIALNYGCDERQIKIVHAAAPPLFLRGPASREAVAREKMKTGLPERYAIFPGNFWPHKNHKMLLAALQLLRMRGVFISLVLVGNQSAADEALQSQITRAKGEKWLFAPGYVTNEAVHALISGAACLLFPSLFEGFGIPVSEAMAVGVPVACSEVCSLPEVGGIFARYFDPNDVESIALTVEETWKKRSDHLTTKARDHARQFNYDRSAADLLEALRTVLEPREAPGFQKIAVNEPMVVSIVTPSYQQGRFLQQCIESVLTQDYPHIEYIVMDGGSTDESRQILEDYGNRFIWRSGKDGGQTAAINAGLRLAKGTILGFLNSDDVLLPGAISRIVEEWRRRPSVDLFYGRANIIDQAGNVVREYDTREFRLQDFKGHCYICQPAAFWHRRVMDHAGPLDEGFQTAMDYEYWQRIAAKDGLIAKVDQILACSRDYETTKTRSQRGEVFSEVFRSQLRHWGRIHPLWWRGWLDYVRIEKRGLHSSFIPSPEKTELLSELLSKLIRKWQPFSLTAVRQFSKTALRLRNFQESGYDVDGWTGPVFCMPLTLKQESRIHLEGICPDRKRLQIVLDTQKAITIEADAGTKFHYEQNLKPGRHIIQIYSPLTLLPGDDTPRGFFIHATNLFSFRESH